MRCRTLMPILLAAVGCHTTPTAEPAPASVPRLPLVAREVTPPNVSRVVEVGLAPPAGPYHRLAADECCTLACSHSSAARAIQAAADGNVPRHKWAGESADAKVRKLAGFHLAREARNQTAAAALDLYYRLLEAELLADYLAASQARVGEMVAAAEALGKSGYKEGTDLQQLRRQQIELKAERARTQAGIRRLNIELKSLIGMDGAESRLLPADRIDVVPDPLDPDRAVQVGLACRSDLQLLRELTGAIDPSSVGAVRASMVAAMPALAAVSEATPSFAPGLGLILKHLLKDDAEALKVQLRAVQADREREVVKDIRAAVDEWATARELVAVVRGRAGLEAERVRELEVRRKSGEAVEAELRRAELDRIKADADLIRESIKWKQADVKARQAMGLLCGL